MSFLKNYKEFRAYKDLRAEVETQGTTLEQLILEARVNSDVISDIEAMQIPSFSSCVSLISNTIAMLPIKLYKEDGKKVEEVEHDIRVKLLNDETGDTLDGFQFKKAIIQDYLVQGAGYAYILKDNKKNAISLHYVDYKNISIVSNNDPIFKDYDINVMGKKYMSHEFLKVTRNSKDGVTGNGIVKENSTILAVSYNTLKYENMIVKTGGNKKGFLKAAKKLSDDAMTKLKEAWNNLYQNSNEKIIVLNEGLEFQEASKTSVEMQLNENKNTNSIEICKLFNVPPEIFNGTFSEAIDNKFVRYAILPIIEAIQIALNKVLLKESEKGSFYFAFDTDERFKGDIEKRFKAYEIAAKNGFMQIDEIRYKENLNPLGLKFIRLGLQDVLYNPETGEIYTPNTNQSVNIESLKKMKGGEVNEN